MMTLAETNTSFTGVSIPNLLFKDKGKPVWRTDPYTGDRKKYVKYSIIFITQANDGKL